MTTTTDASRDLAPRLGAQLRSALCIETRLGLLGLLALVLELGWWGYAWLILRHVRPGQLTPLPPHATTIEAVSSAVLVLTPLIPAIGSLGPALASAIQTRALAFTLTHALSRRRILILRLVPAVLVGWVLDVVALLGHNLLARHIATVHPDWGLLLWQLPSAFGLTLALSATAALIALLLRAPSATIALTLVAFVVFVIGGDLVTPRIPPARVLDTPAATAVPATAAVPPSTSSGVAIASTSVPASDDVLSQTFRYHHHPISFLTAMEVESRCLAASASVPAPEAARRACLSQVTESIRFQPSSHYPLVVAIAFALFALVGILELAALDRRVTRLEL